jgi:hypothetical protein
MKLCQEKEGGPYGPRLLILLGNQAPILDTAALAAFRIEPRRGT